MARSVRSLVLSVDLDGDAVRSVDQREVDPHGHTGNGHTVLAGDLPAGQFGQPSQDVVEEQPFVLGVGTDVDVPCPGTGTGSSSVSASHGAPATRGTVADLGERSVSSRVGRGALGSGLFPTRFQGLAVIAHVPLRSTRSDVDPTV